MRRQEHAFNEILNQVQDTEDDNVTYELGQFTPAEDTTGDLSVEDMQWAWDNGAKTYTEAIELVKAHEEWSKNDRIANN